MILITGVAESSACPLTKYDRDDEMIKFEQSKDSVGKDKGFVNKIWEYLQNSNKSQDEGKIDFGLLIGPHYSTDKKLGLGIVAAGLYRVDRADTLSPPSDVTLYGDVTTGHYYKIGIRGIHIFPYDKFRIDYNGSFDSFKSDFWGIGYDNDNNDNNKSTMQRLQVHFNVSWLWRLTHGLYAGATAVYDFVYADYVERLELLNGMNRRLWNIGGGISLVYDTRNNLTNPKRGVYINVSQLFRPAFLGNKYAFTTTDLRVDIYRMLWEGGVIAADLRSTFNFGNPSWGMMSQLGGVYSMRGYFEGRYRDKNKLESQVELRQHVWRRNSITVWTGVGTVFNKFREISVSHLLPNFGIGYRWEFKKNINLRLDYGFGKKGQQGLIFNVKEAF